MNGYLPLMSVGSCDGLVTCAGCTSRTVAVETGTKDLVTFKKRMD